MSFLNWLTATVAALLPLVAAVAQTPADPADAQAAIPACRYESSFQHYRRAADETETPDAVWISANQALLKQDSHVSHEAAHGAHERQAGQVAASTPKAPAVHHDHHAEGH